MRRLRTWVTTASLVAMLSAAPGPALASGFPDFDAKREALIFGRVAPADRAATSKASTKGSWNETDGKLIRDPGSAGSNAFWLPHGAMFGDGMVRARLQPGNILDGGLMFRVDQSGGKSALSGYELTFDGGSLRLFRYDRGRALPMGAEVKVKRLGKRASVELIVYLVGPQIIATVYDGDKLSRLATLAIHDTTYVHGCVGLRAGPKDSGTAWTLVSMMKARAPTSTPKLQHGQLYGPNRRPDSTPFGNTRFAFIARDDVGKLPKDLRKGVQARLTNAQGHKQALLFTDTVGLERLRRRGIPIASVDSNAPWKAFNAAYRVRSGKAPTKTARGFRLDQSYKNPKMVEALLRAYQGRYPHISKLVKLGESHQGRKLWALKISDNPDRAESEPSVLLNAAHHGSELLTIEYVLDAAAHLLEGYKRDREITRWIDGLEIYCVPLVNPDGNYMFIEESRFAGRKNGRDTDGDGIHDLFEGVDLNRNYPFGWGEAGSGGTITSKYFRGPEPASEPETRSMMSLAADQHFAGVISFHTFGTAIFSPYVVGSAKNPTPDVALAVAMEMSGAAPEQPNDKLYDVRPNSYAVAGSDQDWYLHNYGALAYVVEGSHHNPRPEIRNAAVLGTRPIWKTLVDRVLTGPRISGHVRDAAGKPVEAMVTVDQIKLRAGERWMSRPRDGRFDRIVIGSGRYTVRAKAPGYKAALAEVRVRNGPVDVDLILKRR